LAGQTTGFAAFAGGSPVDLAFSPAQGAFGDLLWVITDESVHGPSSLDANGQSAGILLFEEPSGIAFDPTGAFGGALFTFTPVGFAPSGPFGDGVYSLDDPQVHAVQIAPSLGAIPRRFGPGGPWGTDLYASTGWTLAPDGTETQFPFPFGEFDWMPGQGWGGDMFARCGSDAICRVKPDGTATLFATGASGQNLQVVSCGGFLWVLETGNCRRITASPGPPGP